MKTIFKTKKMDYKSVLLFVFFNLAANEVPTIIISIPKCGTHMLMKYCMLLTDKNGAGTGANWLFPPESQLISHKSEYILITHAVCVEPNSAIFQKLGFKGVFIYRDPRDQIVSLARFMQKNTNIWPIGTCSLGDLITRLITDYSIYESCPCVPLGRALNNGGIKEFYDLYLPWFNYEFIYVTQFEKLVGPKGGGSRKVQLLEITNIARHLNYFIDDKMANFIADNLFGGTGTFVDGQIGTWKKYFTSEQKKIFKKYAGQLLIDLGYEKDFNW